MNLTPEEEADIDRNVRGGLDGMEFNGKPDAGVQVAVEGRVRGGFRVMKQSEVNALVPRWRGKP